jgi:hypothetical protein
MSLDARLARISQDATIIGNLLVVGRSFLDRKEDASNNRARETDLSLAIIISQHRFKAVRDHRSSFIVRDLPSCERKAWEFHGGYDKLCDDESVCKTVSLA